MKNMHKNSVTKHTTLNLNTGLLTEAKMVLSTEGVSETIHRALEEVVKQSRRAWLAQLDLTDLTPEALETMREPRRFDTVAADKFQPA